MIPLCGYTDKLSGRPGDTIAFKVSSSGDEPFDARLMRVISADPNPDGPGIIEEDVESSFARSYASRVQPFYPGSYALSNRNIEMGSDGSLRLEALIWPTAPAGGEQVILAIGNRCLKIDDHGCIAGSVGTDEISASTVLHERRWYKVWMAYDSQCGQLSAGAQPAAGGDNDAVHTQIGSVATAAPSRASIAALMIDERAERHFNGKIEAPAIYNSADASESSVVARWDFAQATGSTRIIDHKPAWA